MSENVDAQGGERFSLDLILPAGPAPDWEGSPSSPEATEQWQLENRLLRIERGDFSTSDRPVEVPFVWKD